MSQFDLASALKGTIVYYLNSQSQQCMDWKGASTLLTCYLKIWSQHVHYVINILIFLTIVQYLWKTHFLSLIMYMLYFNSIIILISLSNILSSSSNSYSTLIAKVSLFCMSHIRNTDPNDPSPNNSPILNRPYIKSPLLSTASSLLRFINYYIFSNSPTLYISPHMLYALMCSIVWLTSKILSIHPSTQHIHADFVVYCCMIFLETPTIVVFVVIWVSPTWFVSLTIVYE